MTPSTVLAANPAADLQHPTLSVRNLTTSFKTGDGWKSVVRDMSFDIQPRRTVAIVGESGSGKSVTSLSIMRLLDPEASRVEGQVLLDGVDLTTLSEREMRQVRGNRISMIFQEPMTSLNPIFPIGRQIAEVKSKLQRMSPVEQGDEYHALFGDLVAMEAYRRSLLEQASGNDLTA